MKRRNWTDEEVEYLQENIGTKTFKGIAKTLNRTETAIILKAKRMGLGVYKNNSDKISLTDVAEILNCDRKVVWHKVNNGTFKKVYRVNIRNGTRMTFLDFDEVMEFSKTYQKQNNKIWSDVDTSRLVMYYNRGDKQKDIAQRLNRTTTAIEHKIKRLKQKGMI